MTRCIAGTRRTNRGRAWVFGCIALLLATAGPAERLYSAELLHQYDFDGNLTDTLATGVVLEQYGNVATSEYGSDGWSWTANANPGGGLKLETALLTDPQSYSLGFRVKYGNVSPGYRKIVSFLGTADDGGLYFLNGNLNFYPFGANASITYTVDTFYDFIFSRSSDDVIKVYIVDGNGAVTKVYEENDPTSASVPIVVGGKYQFLFFCDDTATNSEWTGSGAVRRLRVWNGPLEEADVGNALSNDSPADETPEDESPADPDLAGGEAADESQQSPCINWLLSAYFRFPICGFGCLTAVPATLMGLAGMKLGRRRRAAKAVSMRSAKRPA